MENRYVTEHPYVIPFAQFIGCTGCMIMLGPPSDEAASFDCRCRLWHRRGHSSLDKPGKMVDSFDRRGRVWHSRGHCSLDKPAKIVFIYDCRCRAWRHCGGHCSLEEAAKIEVSFDCRSTASHNRGHIHWIPSAGFHQDRLCPTLSVFVSMLARTCSKCSRPAPSGVLITFDTH